MSRRVAAAVQRRVVLRDVINYIVAVQWLRAHTHTSAFVFSIVLFHMGSLRPFFQPVYEKPLLGTCSSGRCKTSTSKANLSESNAAKHNARPSHLTSRLFGSSIIETSIAGGPFGPSSATTLRNVLFELPNVGGDYKCIVDCRQTVTIYIY